MVRQRCTDFYINEIGVEKLEEPIKNQMMYLAAWGMLKRLLNDGKINETLVEKINKRNAETLMCDYLPIC